MIRMRFQLEDQVIEAEVKNKLDPDTGETVGCSDFHTLIHYRDHDTIIAHKGKGLPDDECPFDKTVDLGELNPAVFGALIALAAGLGEEDAGEKVAGDLYEMVQALLDSLPDQARPCP